VLEATVEGYPDQAKLLDAIIAGPCFRADDFPRVPQEARRPPAHSSVRNGSLFSGDCF